MENIKYIHGDVRKPVGEGRKLILQCVNDIGAMGAGVALAILKKWPIVKTRYKIWHTNNYNYTSMPEPYFCLGNTQFVEVENDIAVANMIGQHGIRRDENGNPPIRYDAIQQCLKNVRIYCEHDGSSVHAPRFGSDLAGGEWNKIEKMIEEELTSKDIPVTVYLFD